MPGAYRLSQMTCFGAIRMRWLTSFCLAGLTLFAASPDARADANRAAQIIQRLEDANQWRDHVMIVAHRGGWKQNGIKVTAENSRAGVESSIALGVEIVELDVQVSRDGIFVVMHDSWLDRTTTCKGMVADYTLADLGKCHLVVEGSGQVTTETVPTLRDMLTLARGRILVNIDNKMGPDFIAAMLDVAREMGMERQVIVKENIWNAERLAAMRTTIAAAGGPVRFMPIIADDAVNDPRFVERTSQAFTANAVEMVVWRGEASILAANAGPLFGSRARAAAVRGNWHLWVNTYPIVNKPAGYLAEGRGDELAVQANMPAEVFGYWAEQGATIIQTDEPKAAIEWLEKNGYRAPYDLTN